ncbi:MAG: VWA domain-containing protein [Bacteroidales bacterium]|nr:VWA domain-containing protein [Bacteroidales bacterium]MCF8392101.1 VWA domain-containing protein [Bacteroidales bacterium]
MIRFERIEFLYLLLLIPVLLVLYFIAYYSSKRNFKKFAAYELKGFLFPLESWFRKGLKFAIWIFAFGMLIIALAGPQVGSKLKEVQKRGREIVIALDVSNSMLSEDIKPNRLEMAKQSLNRMLNEMEDDKVGLIVFAGDAYTQIPITNDYGAARLFLNSVSTEIVSKQGTAIASAIELASRSFSPESADGNSGGGKSRAIIIITDGENHEGDAIAAAKEAAEKGIVIHSIGLGSPEGVPIPTFPGSREFRRDKDGNVVVSRLDETILKQISSITKGYYVRAGKNTAGLQQLMQKINEMETEEYTTKVFAEYIERFQFFVGIALILLLVEFLVMQKKSLWLKKFKIFE